jgi:hypothetical protein
LDNRGWWSIGHSNETFSKTNDHRSLDWTIWVSISRRYLQCAVHTVARNGFFHITCLNTDPRTQTVNDNGIDHDRRFLKKQEKLDKEIN